MTRPLLVINFIFNLMCHFGTFFLNHPFVCVALLFVVLCSIIITQSGILNISNGTKLTAKERHEMWEEAKRRKNLKQVEPKFVCANCGAPLKAEYAICEYCGMRSKSKK